MTAACLAEQSYKADRAGIEGCVHASILGFSITRLCMILDARNSSRRWISTPCCHYLVRNVASSIALSPPPITASGCFLQEQLAWTYCLGEHMLKSSSLLHESFWA